MGEIDKKIHNALDLASRFASTYEPKPDAVLLAGSRARGTSRPNSDFDLVLLYEDLSEGAWREMVEFEGADLEVFAHDLRSIAYFFREIERPSGEPGLARMIEDGIPLCGVSGELSLTAKTMAAKFLALGPSPLDEAVLSHRRYAITDLAEALHTATTSAQRMAIGNALYLALTTFVLRANGRWAAGGKALPAALHDFQPDLPKRVTAAFEELYGTGQDGAVQTLVDSFLHAFGGRLRAGFRQQAPSSWR